ncbi:MAG: CidA/LrgA family protein [Oscillospiraceae bacterium]|nr:CidA/LrgA family protein [Oscillospiraceae bacterium]
MEILVQCGILFGICAVGEAIHFLTGLPIPGNIFGLAILFVLLVTSVLKKSRIERVSDFFLKNMTLFFVPSGVAILVYFNQIKRVIVPFLLIIAFTTLIVMGATGWSAQLIQRWRTRRKKRKKEPAGRKKDGP